MRAYMHASPVIMLSWKQVAGNTQSAFAVAVHFGTFVWHNGRMTSQRYRNGADR